MDPWGHVAPWLYKDLIDTEQLDIRPTIAITKAHMKVQAPQHALVRWKGY